MSKKGAKEKDDSSRVQLFVGILSFIGGLIAVLATIFAPIIQERLKAASQPIATPVIVIVPATETSTNLSGALTAEGPTATLTLTDTPAPTNTFTPIPPVPLIEGLQQGCLSSLWLPYPSSISVLESGDGCLREPVHVFSADNGRLIFLDARSGPGNVVVYGLFAPLPESGSLTFKVRLKDLSNVDLWMGVFSEAEVASPALLMIIPAGNVERRPIVQKDISNYETLLTTQDSEQRNGFELTFEFNPLSARAVVRNLFLTTQGVPIPTAQKWLFLGYRGLLGTYRVEGEFFDFELK